MVRGSIEPLSGESTRGTFLHPLDTGIMTDENSGVWAKPKFIIDG